MQTLFFRLLSHEDKAAALANAIGAVRGGREATTVVHAVDAASFRKMPGSPFVYWVSERIRWKFSELPPFESEDRALRIGDHPGDGFRWLRLYSEVPLGSSERDWRPYHKGGTNSPYFDDVPLVVDWDAERQTYRNFYGRLGRPNERPSNYQCFLKPGITFPYLPHRRGHFAHVPPGGIFGHASPILQLPRDQHWPICALLNSNAFVGLLHLLMPRGSSGGGQTLKYEVGYVRSVPIPQIDKVSAQRLEALARAAYQIRYELELNNECRRLFVVPSLCMEHCQSLADGVAVWRSDVARLRQRLTETQQEINEIAFGLYGITGSDRQMIEDSLNYGHFQILSENGAVGEEAGDEEIGPESEQEDQDYIVELLSYSLGCLLGRWDIRFATDERQPPQLPDPFAPLPVCSPGMLTNVNGLPAAPNDIPGDYPLRISWPGILVDDEGHPEDIIGRVRGIFELIWQECASEIEHETCDLLGVQSLWDYFTRPNDFFAEHLKRYSKSRRKAPIYWPLQTPSGSYTLWLYYHRLNDQTLYTCVNDFVEPKLRQVAEQLNTLRSKTGHSNQENKELERLLNFEQELKDFRDELLRVAGFWKPNLNDGAQITAAPLWKLFQHKPWQKTLKETWDRLEQGDYDWAHLAYSIWPDRICEKCKHDRSLAIAHGLEYLYEEPPAQAKKKRGRK